MGSSDIVDIAMLDDIEDALPVAVIKPDPTRSSFVPVPKPQPAARRNRRNRLTEVAAEL
jgi:hypothetical protein